MGSNCLCLLCPSGPNSVRFRAVLPTKPKPGCQGAKPGTNRSRRSFGWSVGSGHIVQWACGLHCSCPPHRQEGCKDKSHKHHKIHPWG